MTLIADGLLIAGALAAALYCWVLSVRLRSLNDMDSGLGAAIAGLSHKVDEMQAALKATQSAAGSSHAHVEDVTVRAEVAARNLESLLAETMQAKRDARRAQAEAVVAASANQKRDATPKKPIPEVAKIEPEAVATETPSLPNTSSEPAKPKVDARQKASIVPKIESRPVAISAAEKLQNEIKAKLNDRANSKSNDDIVKTIQTLLAANK